MSTFAFKWLLRSAVVIWLGRDLGVLLNTSPLGHALWSASLWHLRGDMWSLVDHTHFATGAILCATGAYPLFAMQLRNAQKNAIAPLQ